MPELISEIAKAVVGVWIALVATLALCTWKKQLKAQIKTDFLMELTDSIHKFIDLMSAPITIVYVIKTGIEVYSDLPDPNNSFKKFGVVGYIRDKGAKDGERLYESLKPCRELLAKIKSLLAKGQVFGLENYNNGYNACNMILWQHERIQGFCLMVESGSLNWDNPKIKKALDNVLTLTSEDIKKNIEEHNVKFLDFVKNNYQKIYK